MIISENGLKLIKKFEGCRLKAYKPVSWEEYYTIGWGHYGPDVKKGMKITQEQADELLKKDMEKYEISTRRALKQAKFKPNQNQYDALVSFCYNCGAGNVQALVKGRTAEEVALSIPKYNKSRDKKTGKLVELAGLTRRRNEELKLFKKKVK